MGIDASNPIEAQKDFLHLRRWRQRTDTVGGRVMLAVVLVVVGFAMNLLGSGFIEFIRSTGA